MRRRQFITLLGGAAAAWPFSARAQQPRRLPTIAVLGVSTPSNWTAWVAAFVRRLGELGWSEGRTATIEYRWAEGRTEKFAEIAAEFVRLKVDVIVTAGSAVSAVKEATSDIPIVFAIASDPVGSGLVASLARPGGNITGLSNQYADLASKRLSLLREALPDLRQFVVMGNVAYAAVLQEMADVKSAAGALGLAIVDTLEIRKPEDIAPAMGTMKAGAHALYMCGEALANRARINTLALGARLPVVYPERSYLEGGGFMSYGVNQTDLFRRAAEYVDKILRGSKPADLPVEQPTKFELVVNLTTAKALGLKIPEAFLLRADEVIE